MSERLLSVHRLDPPQRVGPPALAGVVGAVAALAGGRHLWVVALVPGVIFTILGVRIAYDRRLSRDVDRIRTATPWNAWTPLWYYRQWAGAVITIFGLTFLGIAAEGIASLVS